LTIEKSTQEVIKDLASFFTDHLSQKDALAMAELVYKNRALLSGCNSMQEFGEKVLRQNNS